MVAYFNRSELPYKYSKIWEYWITRLRLLRLKLSPRFKNLPERLWTFLHRRIKTWAREEGREERRSPRLVLLVIFEPDYGRILNACSRILSIRNAHRSVIHFKDCWSVDFETPLDFSFSDWTASENSIGTSFERIRRFVRKVLAQCYRSLGEDSNRTFSRCVEKSSENNYEKYQRFLISGSSFIKQALEGEYPKFLRIYLDLSKRLKDRSQAIGLYAIKYEKHRLTKNQNSLRSWNLCLFSSRDVLSPFENAYLSRSVSRLLDPVHTMFSGDGAPSPDEIDSLIRTVTRSVPEYQFMKRTRIT